MHVYHAHPLDGPGPTQPLYLVRVPAGFPSPAEDYLEDSLNLHEFVVKHPAATFFVKAKGDSMEPDIHSGDMLVVDKSLHPGDGQVVIAIVDGEFTCKRLRFHQGHWLLQPNNPKYPPIAIDKAWEHVIWGVVTWVVHNPNRKK